MTDTTELLPCPFCGGLPAMIPSGDTFSDAPLTLFYWVQCTRCAVSTEACDTEDEASAAWNRRTNTTNDDPMEVEDVATADGD